MKDKLQILYVCPKYAEYYKEVVEANHQDLLKVQSVQCSCGKQKDCHQGIEGFDRSISHVICTDHCQVLRENDFMDDNICLIHRDTDYVVDPEYSKYLLEHGAVILTEGNLVELFGQADCSFKADKVLKLAGSGWLVIIAGNGSLSSDDLKRIEKGVEKVDIIAPSKMIIQSRLQQILDRIRINLEMDVNRKLYGAQLNYRQKTKSYFYSTTFNELSDIEDIEVFFEKIEDLALVLFGAKQLKVISEDQFSQRFGLYTDLIGHAFLGDHCLYIFVKYHEEIYRIIELSHFVTEEAIDSYEEDAEGFGAALSLVLTKLIIESELRLSQSKILMKEKMRSIGQIAGGVAHEINNPLSFIASNMQVLQMYLEDYRRIIDVYDQLVVLDDSEMAQNKAEMDEDIPDLMTEMTEGVERISKVVNRFRSVTNVDSQAEYELIAMKKLIEDTIYLYSSSFSEQARFNLNLLEVPEIYGNRGELSLSLYDIIENAIDAIVAKAPGYKGTITIHTFVDNDYVCTDVIDDGKGLDSESSQFAFEPFYTSKEVGKGIGLGLTFAYDVICHRHSGEIQLTTRADGQTVCHIRLPIAPKGD